MAQKYRFRNIFGKTHTKWEDILPLGGATDGYIIAGNSKFIAFPLQGGMGSTLGVLNYQQAGRVKSIAQLRGHSAHITDFKFLPYQENLVATASQDSTVKIWHVEDENTQDIDGSLTTLSGHGLKVNLIAPHHAAKGILATASYDKTIKVWNSEEGKDVLTINQGSQYALCLEWSHDGSLLGSTWNDKQVRIIDPRTQSFVKEFGAHQSTRAQKLSWLGDTSYFVTTGFDQNQKRQIFLWDIRNTSSHIQVEGCTQAQGVLHTHYDSDLGLLYTNGKGEGLIRFFEYVNGSLITHQNDIMVKDTTKGYCFLPKYTVDTNNNELCRVIKLCSKYAEAVSIVYPRKTNDFQDDLYPDCAIDFGQTAQQWLSGSDIQPKVTSMKGLNIAAQGQQNINIKPAVQQTQNIANLAKQNQEISQPINVQSQPKENNSKQVVENKKIDNPEENKQKQQKDDSSEHQNENKSLKNEIANKSEEINELKQQIQQLQASQEEQQNAQSSSQGQVEEFNAEISRLKQELQQQSEQTAQLQSLQEQSEKLKQTNEELSQQIAALRQNNNDRNSHIQVLSEAINNRSVDNEQLLVAAKALVEFVQNNQC